MHAIRSKIRRMQSSSDRMRLHASVVHQKFTCMRPVLKVNDSHAYEIGLNNQLDHCMRSEDRLGRVIN